VRPRVLWILILSVVAAVLVSLTMIRKENGDRVLCVDCCFGGHHHHASEGLRAPNGLQALTTAQADFRVNDRDGDGVKQFWRADIAGLYALAPGGGPAIKLIPLRLAAADDRPLPHLQEFAVRAACSGYWYRAIRHANEDPKALHPNRFAYCAYPDNASAGKDLYVVDETYTIYRCPADGRRGIEVFPTNEELKSWTMLD
jgi:hypothetical protein